ncbi:MAG: sigma-54 dependent transcriptional regulator [Candidatus Binatia bacterium]|jgi:DNA-binding NtrC family response regulator
MSGVILVADDEVALRHNISEALEEEGYQVRQAPNGGEALKLLESADFDVVLTDLRMPGTDGLTVLKHVREVSPQTLVVIMTAFASVDTALEALRLGVQDYILKPVSLHDVLGKVNRLMEQRNLLWENQMLRRELNRGFDLDGLVGKSRSVQEVIELIQKVADTNSTALITGESGAGKEVVARAIHFSSSRRDKVFLPVNCSAIPDNLLESQLFGHVRGAFTGAVGAQDGLFQRARGGTIFLDEIGEMPLNLQPKLLRTIEAKEILSVGATNPVRVDVRIVASTNRDLSIEVKEGRFREDLFYRLNVINIRVPALRQRREDIPLLADHLIRRHNLEMKTRYKGVESAAIKSLMALPWKGNIRELDNALERAMILGDGEWIRARDLPRAEASETLNLATKDSLDEAVDAYEKIHIENVLKEVDGDRTRAAKILGVSRSSLYRKIDKFGIGA